MKIPHRIISEEKKVGPGSSQPSYSLLKVITKHNDDVRRYTISNEIVALGFAQYFHLPVPPGGLAMNHENTQPRFFSLEIYPDSQKPFKAVDPIFAAHKFPELSWRIILFDAFLINKDRNPTNLVYDESLDSLAIFDHGDCILGITGQKKLQKHAERIGTGNHCLEKNVKTAAGYKNGIEEIHNIPDAFISKTVKRGEGVGYSKADCDLITDYLIQRKTRIHELVKKQINKFKALVPAEREKILKMKF